MGRLEGRYLVPAEHPSPESVRSRLDAVTQDALHLAVAALGSLWPTNDGGVWLVRRLDVEVDVDAGWEPGDLARGWAIKIARSLYEALRSCRDGGDENAVYFESRQAYLSRFLVDLAGGAAWGRWYYQPFEGLRMLPPSQAIRTVLLDDPATGLAAVGLLPPAGLAAVVRAMSRSDATRTLEGLSEVEVSSADQAQCLEALCLVWAGRAEAMPIDESDEARTALTVYLLARRVDPTFGGSTLKRAALAIARFATHFARKTEGINRLLAAMESRDMSRLYLVVGTADAQALSPLLDAPDGLVRRLTSIMEARGARRGGERIEPSGEPVVLTTRFGGAILLLPLLDRLPLEDLTAGWPDLQDTGAATLLRHLLLVCSLGQERAPETFFDPALRELMLIDPRLFPQDVSEWIAKVGARRLDRLLEGLRAWWSDNSATGDDEIIVATVPSQNRRTAPIVILLDTARGIWLSATSSSGESSTLAEKLRASLMCVDPSATVYVEPGLLPVMGAMGTALRVATIPRLPSEEAGAELSETLARLDRLSSDLYYLSLPREWRVPRWAAPALAVAAMGVLRDFAWRLPGFSRSSLPYLYTNFLDLRASVECGRDKFIATLGRPPLNLVLNMTGIARSTVTLSWLDKPMTMFTD